MRGGSAAEFGRKWIMFWTYMHTYRGGVDIISSCRSRCMKQQTFLNLPKIVLRSNITHLLGKNVTFLPKPVKLLPNASGCATQSGAISITSGSLLFARIQWMREASESCLPRQRGWADDRYREGNRSGWRQTERRKGGKVGPALLQAITVCCCVISRNVKIYRAMELSFDSFGQFGGPLMGQRSVLERNSRNYCAVNQRVALR